MAYDENAPYQPPRRTPYGQSQPQAPVRAANARHRDEQYGNYDEGYGQSYSQQSGGGGGHGNYDGYDGYNEYDQGAYNEQHWQANGGYHEGYDQRDHQGQWQQRGYRETPQERSYDPRYQQRPSRGTASQAQQNGQRSRPPPERQGFQVPPSDQPRHRGQPPRPQEPRADSGWSGPDSSSRGDARQPQQSSRGRDAGDRSMRDWKAQEKAKMNASATSPDYMPQDTAFPRIGNQPERPNTSGGRVNVRTSDDHKRPASGRSDPRSQRPSGSREHSYAKGLPSDEYAPQYGQRPRDPPPSREPTSAYQDRGYSETYHQGSNYYQDAPDSRQVADFGNKPTEGQDQNWPLGNQQAKSESRSKQQTPAQANGYGSRYDVGAPVQSGYESQPRQYQYRDQSARPPDRGMPPVQRVNTNIPQTVSSSMNHHPLSPVDVVPRPATASGARQVPAPKMATPVSQVPQSATVEDYAAPKPWMQHTKAESLGDLYADYGADSVAAAKSRDEEIEDEMPDFDAPATASNSSQHKRNKTVDRHLNEGALAAAPPPMPTMPSQYNDQHARPQQGYVGREAPRVADQYQYEQNYETMPQQSSNRPHYAPPTRPPQRTQEETERRSVDNAQQMPYRPGPPPGQRFYQQNAPGQAPRGPVPPGRPGLDRNGTGQSTWSDPGQSGAPSAPPGGQRRPQPQSSGAGSGQQDQQDAQKDTRLSNPDALPHHPTPVRPGLTGQGLSKPDRPPPVRNYNHNAKENPPAAPAAPPGAQRQNSDDPFAQPVTNEELNRLRAEVDANPHNPKRALILAKKLVEASTVLASEGGRLDQRAAAKNRERYIMDAYKRVKKLVAQGYPEAQFYFADCYGQGMLGLEVDTKEAFNLYQAAAKAGHAQAAYRTAVCCEMGPEEGGGTRRDYPKAVQWYRRAAALGEPAAMFKLGAVLLRGLLGSPRNVGEAVNWLKRAAERADADHPHALHELAGLYDAANTDPEVRNKVIADDKYARELFQRAAKLGYKQSQFRLGQAHEYGQLGLTIDNRQSITWYTKAAAQGEHQAELALSGWYLTGAEGILEHSDTEAYLWARKAAMSEPPLAKALFAMGYFTEMGIGCPASLDEAKKWYGRAASQQFPKALERLEELKKNGGKGVRPANSRLTRKDQKRDEAECVVM